MQGGLALQPRLLLLLVEEAAEALGLGRAGRFQDNLILSSCPQS
jgi:hypothetical protein